jgi:ubiquinone/menaquinone biosynthesis C-methylase UbiE
MKDRNDVAILDACCGYGRLIHFMLQEFPNISITGIDYSQNLIDEGRRKFKTFHNVSFECCDLTQLPKKYEKKFDFCINYKTLSWLPYYEEILVSLIRSTKDKIYITSLFHEADIDVICKIFPQVSDASGNYSHLNTYSIKKFSEFCQNNGATKIKTTDIKIPFDFGVNAPYSDLLQSYSMRNDCGKILEFTSIIQLNWKLVEIFLT